MASLVFLGDVPNIDNFGAAKWPNMEQFWASDGGPESGVKIGELPSIYLYLRLLSVSYESHPRESPKEGFLGFQERNPEVRFLCPRKLTFENTFELLPWNSQNLLSGFLLGEVEFIQCFGAFQSGGPKGGHLKRGHLKIGSHSEFAHEISAFSAFFLRQFHRESDV